MSAQSDKILERSPLAASPLTHYSHGLLSVNFATFFQDPQGRIRHTGAIGDGIAVDVDKQPSINKGFAVLGWNNNVNEDNELRLYYTNTAGNIFEAATYSQLAANSQNGDRTRVYYQDPDTDEICSLLRNRSGGGFELLSREQAGVKGTSIATDTGGESGLWYQLPDLTFVHYGGLPQGGDFVTQLEHPAGASIAAAGTRVFTVTKSNKLAVTVYDTETHKWRPSVELTDVMPLAPLAATIHEKPSSGTHTGTVFTQRVAHDLARVEFTDENTINISSVEV